MHVVLEETIERATESWRVVLTALHARSVRRCASLAPAVFVRVDEGATLGSTPLRRWIGVANEIVNDVLET